MRKNMDYENSQTSLIFLSLTMLRQKPKLNTKKEAEDVIWVNDYGKICFRSMR